jgi:hypothetical protein
MLNNKMRVHTHYEIYESEHTPHKKLLLRASPLEMRFLCFSFFFLLGTGEGHADTGEGQECDPKTMKSKKSR